MGKGPKTKAPASGLTGAGGLAAALGGFTAAAQFAAPAASLQSVLATSSLDGEASLLLKRLSKKDTVTKLKALDELLAAVGANDASWAEAFLPHWASCYARLASDGAWRVRERACAALGALAALLRKQLAPQLKRLVVPWLCCEFDPQPDVRRAAKEAWRLAFPNAAKDAEVLVHCRDELVRGLAEVALLPPPQKCGDADADAAAALDDERSVAAALQAAAHVVRAVPAAHAAALRPLLDEELLAAETWRRFGGAKAAGVRAAAYALAQACLEAAWAKPEGDALHRLSVLLLDGLGEKEPSCHRALWPPLLLLLRAEPAAVRAALAPKHVIARLKALLRAGCHGAAHTVYHALLPLVAMLPDELLLPPTGGGGGGGAARLAPAAELLAATWEGLNADALPSAHFGALLSGYGDLTQLLLARAAAAGPDAQAALLAAFGAAPLVQLLDGSLPSRLGEDDARAALAELVARLALSSKTTDAVAAYWAPLCAQCAAAAATGADGEARAAAFVCAIHDALAAAAAAAAPDAAPRAAAHAAALRRGVGALSARARGGRRRRRRPPRDAGAHLWAPRPLGRRRRRRRRAGGGGGARRRTLDRRSAGGGRVARSGGH